MKMLLQLFMACLALRAFSMEASNSYVSIRTACADVLSIKPVGKDFHLLVVNASAQATVEVSAIDPWELVEPISGSCSVTGEIGLNIKQSALRLTTLHLNTIARMETEITRNRHMKDILRTNSFILMIFAFCVSSSSATQTAPTISERDDDATKKSHHIAARIRSLSTNVQFFVSCEGGCAGADYNKARSYIPFYSAFGLKAVSPLLRSQEIRQRQDDLIFLYESQETFDGRWGWRPLPMQRDMGGSHYVGQRHGLVTIGFIVKVTTPIKERFTAVEAVVNGERRCTTYESAFADFNIDKAKFDEVFAKQVFMRCHCGLFGVEHSTAKRIMDHDAGSNKFELSQAKVQSRGLIFLDGREISEMVYWLWQRKGKVDEYDSFVKAHPELFEPIAGEEEFRTELGRRLVGTWK